MRSGVRYSTWNSQRGFSSRNGREPRKSGSGVEVLGVASGVRCSCEMRECGSEKCAGRWVVSIQRCLWLCRGKVAVRHSERAILLRGARRVEDLGSSASSSSLSFSIDQRSNSPTSSFLSRLYIRYIGYTATLRSFLWIECRRSFPHPTRLQWTNLKIP